MKQKKSSNLNSVPSKNTLQERRQLKAFLIKKMEKLLLDDLLYKNAKKVQAKGNTKGKPGS